MFSIDKKFEYYWWIFRAQKLNKIEVANPKGVRKVSKKKVTTTTGVIKKQYTKQGQECTKDDDCCGLGKDMCSGKQR